MQLHVTDVVFRQALQGTLQRLQAKSPVAPGEVEPLFEALRVLGLELGECALDVLAQNLVVLHEKHLAFYRWDKVAQSGRHMS